MVAAAVLRVRTRRAALAAAVLALAACGEVWNDPYPAAGAPDNTLYSSFSQRPKHLDPAKSYTEDEAEFNAQIYEPPFQYHYFRRPYELVTATATAIPRPRYLDAAGRELPSDAAADAIATSIYDIRIRPGIRYQPHPAFVEANRALPREAIARHHRLADFGPGATRALVAADYVYQIKRLAHPRVNSPIFGHMTDYIAGLKEYGETLKGAQKALEAERGRGAWLDLRRHDIAGVSVLDEHTFRVTVKGKYPQFLFWMAMPFFAPIPWEVDQFYAQPGMAEKNFSLDWYPVGTGPYMLVENDPNARMVLLRNPNFRGEPYPADGEPGDREAGLLADAGRTMPFIDRVVFTREKETIPYWNKFLQGYYDRSGIASDNFDQAVRTGSDGETQLTAEMEARGIRLSTSLSTSSYYLAFNWLDPVVGGPGERAKKLRRALSIVVDFDEFISIFLNGRAIPGQGPLPPGIFGFRDGPASVNPMVYDWSADGGGRASRKAVTEARRLLAEAGYPDGRDARTGAPLVLALDTTDRGPGDKARLDWYRKQFAKINVQLEIRGTDWNRFQEKIRKGNTQMFFLGWNADYPDPENFLFLLYGPNSAAKSDGENKANYANPEYDALFERMKNLDNGPERQAVIDRMVAILREDAPWMWGFHPKSYGLAHSWVANGKPNQMARNGLKYQRVDHVLRAQKRAEWNRPVVWPFALLVAALGLLGWLGLRYWRRSEAAVAVQA
ncbi:MAG: ABC transporter substrate-binding protein [Burkholderiales bacterium]|nr:ABC transporter substrate-binding protein [Burkholderiales bacterium]